MTRTKCSLASVNGSDGVALKLSCDSSFGAATTEVLTQACKIVFSSRVEAIIILS
jgi:hypothetical protein